MYESHDATFYPKTHMLKLVNNASLCVSKSWLCSALTILAQLALLLVKVSHELEFFPRIPDLFIDVLAYAAGGHYDCPGHRAAG